MNNLWSPADTRYLKSCMVSLLLVSAVIFGCGLCSFHSSLKYDMIDHLIDKVSMILGTIVKSVFVQQKKYIKSNFYDVVRADQFYNTDLDVYFDTLLSTTGKQERSLSIFVKFQIWFWEFFLMFVMMIAIILSLMANLQ